LVGRVAGVELYEFIAVALLGDGVGFVWVILL
jgi:hypothetical protein